MMPAFPLRRLAALAVSLLSLARPASAQLFGLGQVGRVFSVDGIEEGGTFYDGPQPFVHYLGTHGDYAYEATARVGPDGLLHASAEIANASLAASGAVGMFVAMRDEITFEGIAPRYLELDVFLHGRATGHSSGMLSMYYNSLGEFHAGPLAIAHISALDAFGGAYWNGTDDEQRVTYGAPVRIDVADGMTGFELQLYASAHLMPPECSATDGNCGSPALTRSATADFGNTAGIAGMRAYDADGNLIGSGLVARSALGYTYQLQGGRFVAPNVVPEPGTWMLLGTGLLALGGLAARRRVTA